MKNGANMTAFFNLDGNHHIFADLKKSVLYIFNSAIARKPLTFYEANHIYLETRHFTLSKWAVVGWVFDEKIWSQNLKATCTS